VKSSGKDGQYAVQVGAFADAANVNRIKSKIQSLGLPAYTDRLGNTTRVRAGPFKDRATAEKAAVKLAAAGLPVKLDGP
jgi:DedD protein